MKAQVLTIFSVLFFGMTSTFSSPFIEKDPIAGGTGQVECVVYTSHDGLIVFRMVKNPGDVVKVGLYDFKGNLLTTRRYKRANNVKLSYDLSACPEGVYQIRVKADREVIFSTSITYPQEILAGK